MNVLDHSSIANEILLVLLIFTNKSYQQNSIVRCLSVYLYDGIIDDICDDDDDFFLGFILKSYQLLRNELTPSSI